MVSKQLM